MLAVRMRRVPVAIANNEQAAVTLVIRDSDDAGVVFAWRFNHPMSHALSQIRIGNPLMQMTIYPYLLENACWVFDDERTGLKEEAFVFGMTEMISKLVEAKAVPGRRRFSHPMEVSESPTSRRRLRLPAPSAA